MAGRKPRSRKPHKIRALKRAELPLISTEPRIFARALKLETVPLFPGGLDAIDTSRRDGYGRSNGFAIQGLAGNPRVSRRTT
jgi:hypothetical protein